MLDHFATRCWHNPNSQGRACDAAGSPSASCVGHLIVVAGPAGARKASPYVPAACMKLKELEALLQVSVQQWTSVCMLGVAV